MSLSAPPSTEKDNEQKVETASKAQGKKMTPLKMFGVFIGGVFLLAFGLVIGIMWHATSSDKSSNMRNTIGSWTQIIAHPEGGFPGKSKIVIACMGIDDNWTNNDEVYTTGTRTDTLFLLTLDLHNRKATMLSIPRDTYVPIAGTNYSSKINGAFATGGPKRTIETIKNWLGVNPDYYLVLNIDATKRLVDALGGVDVNVENQMDYDDNWGHLHVHLKPGLQHLNGDNAVAFARYRHGNHGTTPEDGDERRMYRQHVLLRAMTDKTKSFETLLQANQLIDTAMGSIRTNLTRTQLFDLGAMFHNLNQDDLVTASLNGEDARGPNGVYVMKVDQRKAELFRDWLVNDDQTAAYKLTPILIDNNDTSTDSSDKIENLLKSRGYTDTHVIHKSDVTPGTSITINDSGVPDKTAADSIKALINLPGAVVTHNPPKPNRNGWIPPPSITISLGSATAGSSRARE